MIAIVVTRKVVWPISFISLTLWLIVSMNTLVFSFRSIDRIHGSDTAGSVGCLKGRTQWILKTIKRIAPNVGRQSLCGFEIGLTMWLARSFGWSFQLSENERRAATVTSLMSSCDRHVRSFVFVQQDKKSEPNLKLLQLGLVTCQSVIDGLSNSAQDLTQLVTQAEQVRKKINGE